MTKKLKHVLGLIFLLMCNFSYAISKTKMPSEVKKKTGEFEGMMAWAITIGGVVIIGLCIWAIHKNKGQGGWIEQVAWAIMGLAFFSVLITWWVTLSAAANQSAGFLF